MNSKNLFTLFIIFLFSFPINAQPVEEKIKLLASDGEADDMFGNSMSISGDLAVIGTPQDDDAAYNGGAAYIYERNGETWDFVQKITAADAEGSDFFGTSVDIDGDYIVVSAYQAVGVTGNTGAAYIFKNNGTTWEQEAKIFANDGESGDNFGKSVAISGNYVVAGADGEDFGTGAAYVFEREDVTWTQIAKLEENDEEDWDYFAHSVDISGDYIVGGSAQNNAAGSNSGAAYVFYNNAGTWEQTAKLVANDGTVDDALGYSVSISGNSVVAGAYYNNGKGAAYVFYNNSGTWEQQAKLIANDGNNEDFFGKSVSISDDFVIVGAQRHSSKAVEGAAYLYVRESTTWTQENQFFASDANDTGLFGYCVSIDNDFAFISTVQDNGAVYVFGPEEVVKVNSIKSDIIVYPNPTISSLTIKNAKNSDIKIIDIYGRTIQQLSLNSNQFNIDLSNCNSGIYFLEIELENSIYYKKIIKK